MIPRTSATSACLAFLLTLGLGLPSTARAQAVSYVLSVGSEFDTGCFTPDCTCAQVQNAMSGTLVLVRQAPDAQYAHYFISGLSWRVQFLNGFVPISGTGTYRVGGTPVMQQQMTLDLTIGGGPLLHFDSGLVRGGDNFPRLDIAVPLHGFCVDTLLKVRADPDGSTTGVPPIVFAPGAIAPNPFHSATRLVFALREDGPVRVSIRDAAGRTVRTLVDGAWMAAGPQAMAWDGWGDDGRDCPPGCYFVHVQAAGASQRRTLIKLR